MSKLYSIYLNEKEKNEANIILFKSGIFYLALDKDAIFLSNTFGLKLTNFNNDIKKCGFPCNSLDKYLKIFKAFNLPVNIVDSENSTNYTLKEFELNKASLEILELIKNVDTDNLSVLEAYSFIETLKDKAINI